jgi:outer membrane immunogenic protein
MRKHIALLMAAAILASGPAIAGSPTPAAPEPSPVVAASGYDWTGGYVGLQFGALNADQAVNNVSRASGLRNSWAPDPSGTVGGLYAGYNWQRGASFVYGVEAEYNWANADGSDVITAPVGIRTLTETVEANISRTAALRARIGYALDRTLVYATGGLAWIDQDGAYTGELTGRPPSQIPWSGSHTGWTIGLGVERAFGDRWVGRIDYRYSDYGDIYYSPFATSNITTPSNDLSGSLTTQEVRVGMAMRF